VIVKKAEELMGTKFHVREALWSSLRLLCQSDGMGFTLTDTHLSPGHEVTLCYKDHLEACYCLEGEALVEDLSTGDVYEIKPGTLYALDKHDHHRLRARTRVRLICVFTPALRGDETHDSAGSYAAIDAPRVISAS
jgi:L-ectoine synthase